MTETDPAALAAFIGNQRTEHRVPHRLACQVVGVSEFLVLQVARQAHNRV